jgi:hypothetical protein
VSLILTHFSFSIGFSKLIAVSICRLIAIMLGRLDMTIDECIEAYNDLSSKIFGQNHDSTVALGHNRYSSSKFEETVKEFIEKRTGDRESLMMPTDDKHCKVSVPSFLQRSLILSFSQQFRCCRSSWLRQKWSVFTHSHISTWRERIDPQRRQNLGSLSCYHGCALIFQTHADWRCPLSRWRFRL